MENKLVFEPTTLTQYHWNKYNIETTYTYYWKLYTAIADYLYTYYWNKYEVLPTQAPTWNKYDAAEVYAYKYYWDMYNATQKSHKHYERYKSYPVGDWTLNWDKAIAKYRVRKDKVIPSYYQDYDVYRTTTGTTRTYYKGDMFFKMKPDSQITSSDKNFYFLWTRGGTLSGNFNGKRITPLGIYSGIIPKHEVEGYKIKLYQRLGGNSTLNIFPFDEDTGLPITNTDDNTYGAVYPWGCDTPNTNTSGFTMLYSDYLFYDTNNQAYTIVPNSYFNWDDGKAYNVMRVYVENIPDSWHRDEYNQYHAETEKTWSMGVFQGYVWMSKSRSNSYGHNKNNSLNITVYRNNTNNPLLVVGHTYWFENGYNGTHKHSPAFDDLSLYNHYANEDKEISDYDAIMIENMITGYQTSMDINDIHRIYSTSLFDKNNPPTFNEIGVDYDITYDSRYADAVYITQETTTSNLYKTGNKITTFRMYVMDTSWCPDYFIDTGNWWYNQVQYEFGTFYFEKSGSPHMDTQTYGKEVGTTITTTNKNYYPLYNQVYVENSIPYIAYLFNASNTYYTSSDFTTASINVSNSLKPNPSTYHSGGYNNVEEDNYIYVNPTISLDTINSFNRPNEFVQDDYCETNTSLSTNDWIVDNTNFIYNYRVYIGVEHYWEKGTSTGQQVSSFDRNAYPNNNAQDGRWYVYNTRVWEPNGEYQRGSTSYGKVYSANDDTYPHNGKLGDYWYVYAGLTTLPVEQRLQLLEEVQSNNRNEYPDDGLHTDDYYYRYTNYTREIIGYHRGEDIGQTVLSTQISTYPLEGNMDETWYSFSHSIPHYHRGSLIDNVSSFIQSAYPQDSYVLNDAWYIYIGTSELITGQLTIDKSQLMGGVNYTQEVNASEDLQIGTTGAAQVDFTIYAPDAAAATQYLGKDFTYYVMMPHDNEWRQVGVFTLTKAELPDKQTAKIEGFDYIYKFDVIVDEWLDSLTFPMTLGNFFNSLCQYVGCEAYSTDFNNSSFQVNDNFEAVQITGRTILQYITEVSGGFCVAEPDGRIHIKQYSIPPTGTINLGNDSYVKYTHEIYNVPVITSVVVRKDDEDEGVESNV